jgi:hypothetical protein
LPARLAFQLPLECFPADEESFLDKFSFSSEALGAAEKRP